MMQARPVSLRPGRCSKRRRMIAVRQCWRLLVIQNVTACLLLLHIYSGSMIA